MSPRHHLDPATVLGFAAGSLGPEMSVVASAHMESCGHCRQQLRLAERIGGLLLDQQACPVPGKDTQAALRQAMVDKLDRIPASRGEQGLSPMGRGPHAMTWTVCLQRFSPILDRPTGH